MSKQIGLIGDLIMDRYIYFKSIRLSPEGPAPIVKQVKSFTNPGGAANVALSLFNLGLDFKFYYPCNDNRNAKTNILETDAFKNLNCFSEKIITNFQDITPIKTRYYVDDRQYMREDKEGNNLNKLGIISKDFLDKFIKNNDIILVSDYQKGCFNTKNLQYLIRICNQFKKPIFIDTKNTNCEAIKNAFCLKINIVEFNSLFLEYEILDSDELNVIKEKIKKVKDNFKIKNLVVTLGSQGSIASTNVNTLHSPANKVDVIDITGAGDAFLSALIYSFLKIKSEKKEDYFNYSIVKEHINFANYAASSVVAKKGTEPIDKKFVNDFDYKLNKQKIIGFTNGCFDVLHIGHLYLIEQSKKYCDYLILGLNSDESIKRIKGKKRPINDESFRMKLLKSLNLVDEVIIFSEDTPEKLIREIKPDVLIKGSDYKEEEIVGSSFVKDNGGKVIRIKFKHNISSSNIIEHIKNS